MFVNAYGISANIIGVALILSEIESNALTLELPHSSKGSTWLMHLLTATKTAKCFPSVSMEANINQCDEKIKTF